VPKKNDEADYADVKQQIKSGRNEFLKMKNMACGMVAGLARPLQAPPKKAAKPKPKPKATPAGNM